MIHIDTSCIDTYLKHILPKPDEWYYEMTGGCQPISDRRQEVCVYLCEVLKQYAHFPLWNRDLIWSLLGNVEEELRDVTMMPVVGCAPSFDAGIIMHEQRPVLLVDLLHIADYTQSVKEMCYILHNLCHMHLLRYLMARRFPQPDAYLPRLAYRFFSEGFVLYLSWNEDYTRYAFDASVYDQRRQRCFALMEAARHVSDTQIRSRIMHTLENGDLWDRFTDVAGMFFLAEVYREEGTMGLHAYFDQGWAALLQEETEATASGAE